MSRLLDRVINQNPSPSAVKVAVCTVLCMLFLLNSARKKSCSGLSCSLKSMFLGNELGIESIKGGLQPLLQLGRWKCATNQWEAKVVWVEVGILVHGRILNTCSLDCWGSSRNSESELRKSSSVLFPIFV